MGPFLSRCVYSFFLVRDHGSPGEQLCLLICLVRDYGSHVEHFFLFFFG